MTLCIHVCQAMFDQLSYFIIDLKWKWLHSGVVVSTLVSQ